MTQIIQFAVSIYGCDLYIIHSVYISFLSSCNYSGVLRLQQEGQDNIPRGDRKVYRIPLNSTSASLIRANIYFTSANSVWEKSFVVYVPLDLRIFLWVTVKNQIQSWTQSRRTVVAHRW